MLSRVAESIYWMAVYVERAEHIARMINVNWNVLIDVGDVDEALEQNLWRGVLRVLHLENSDKANAILSRGGDMVIRQAARGRADQGGDKAHNGPFLGGETAVAVLRGGLSITTRPVCESSPAPAAHRSSAFPARLEFGPNDHTSSPSVQPPAPAAQYQDRRHAGPRQ